MSGPRVCSRVEASFYRWRKQSYRQRACRWLAQSMSMKAAKPPLIDAVVFVVFIFGLIHFTVEFAVAGRFEHAGFHSAKALLSKTSNGFFI
jgi:hypothetical protein